MQTWTKPGKRFLDKVLGTWLYKNWYKTLCRGEASERDGTQTNSTTWIDVYFCTRFCNMQISRRSSWRTRRSCRRSIPKIQTFFGLRCVKMVFRHPFDTKRKVTAKISLDFTSNFFYLLYSILVPYNSTATLSAANRQLFTVNVNGEIDIESTMYQRRHVKTAFTKHSYFFFSDRKRSFTEKTRFTIEADFLRTFALHVWRVHVPQLGIAPIPETRVSRIRARETRTISIVHSDWSTSKQKVLRHGNRFAARVRRRYFSEWEKRRPGIRLRFAAYGGGQFPDYYY